MPSGNAPTVRQRRIGSALRKARDRRDLTVATAARRFGRSQGWLSMVENGLQTIAPKNSPTSSTSTTSRTAPLRESLLHLAAHKPGSWERAYENRLSGAALDLAGLEEDAAEIRTFQSNIVPGLLQIPEYARSIIACGAEHPHSIKTLVDFRPSRQRVLSRSEPPHYTPIIAEAVLHNRVGGNPAILQAQVQRMAVAARLDHVELRVLPSTASEYLGLITPYHLVSLRPSGRLTVSVYDQPTKSIFLEDEGEVATHQEIFELLLSASPSRSASLSLVEEAASRA
ncbi:MAG TPA: helix-turn-helix transcriptional regulator [Spirillospora sp.]